MTSFLSQLGLFEWFVVLFGLQGPSSLPMRVMNEALTVVLAPRQPSAGACQGRRDRPADVR